jgi:uncharacterized peroxidase-related enzyme
MTTLKVHTIASAPEASRHSLEEVQHKLGNIPNLYGTLANSPELLNGYMALNHQWERTSLSPKERELIFLSASVANQCPYCTAGYTAGLQQMHTSGDIIRQVLYNEAVQDPKINALVALVKELVNNRGFVTEAARKAFVEAGYQESVILEILIGIAMKTMANYLDHIFPIPIDKAYQEEYNAVIREVHE